MHRHAVGDRRAPGGVGAGVEIAGEVDRRQPCRRASRRPACDHARRDGAWSSPSSIRRANRPCAPAGSGARRRRRGRAAPRGRASPPKPPPTAVGMMRTALRRDAEDRGDVVAVHVGRLGAGLDLDAVADAPGKAGLGLDIGVLDEAGLEGALDDDRRLGASAASTSPRATRPRDQHVAGPVRRAGGGAGRPARVACPSGRQRLPGDRKAARSRLSTPSLADDGATASPRKRASPSAKTGWSAKARDARRSSCARARRAAVKTAAIPGWAPTKASRSPSANARGGAASGWPAAPACRPGARRRRILRFPRPSRRRRGAAAGRRPPRRRRAGQGARSARQGSGSPRRCVPSSASRGPEVEPQARRRAVASSRRAPLRCRERRPWRRRILLGLGDQPCDELVFGDLVRDLSRFTIRKPWPFPAAIPRSASRASPGPFTTQPITATRSGTVMPFFSSASFTCFVAAQDVDLGATARRAGDQIEAAPAQSQRLQDRGTDLDLLDGIVGERNPDRVADALGEERPDPDGALHAPPSASDPPR